MDPISFGSVDELSKTFAEPRDELSITLAEARDEFSKMLAKAREGKISRIEVSPEIFGLLEEQDIKDLAEVLKTSTSIVGLKFSNVSMSVHAARKIDSLAEALAVNSSLRHLDLSNNYLGNEGLNKIVAALASNSNMKLETLLLESTVISNINALLVMLITNTSIFTLNISHNHIALTGADYKNISDLLKSKIAHLKSKDIDSADKELKKSKSWINTSLKNFIFQFGYQMYDPMPEEDMRSAYYLSHILSCFRLESLDLGYNPLGIFMFSMLMQYKKCTKDSEHLTQLKHLNLEGISPRIGSIQGSFLSPLKTLTAGDKITVQSRAFTSIGVVMGMTNLEIKLQSMNLTATQFYIDNDSPTPPLIKMLNVNSELIKLDLRCNYITAEGAKRLAEHLGQKSNPNNKLQYLDLSKNPIGKEGRIAFAKMLETNHGLLCLKLRETEIDPYSEAGMKEIDSQTGPAFARALGINSVLKELDLSGNKIDFNTVDLQTTDFQDKTNDRSNMSGTNNTTAANNTSSIIVDPEQPAGLFAQMIQKNESLTELNITRNHISEKTGMEFTLALRSNISLQNFKYNGLDWSWDIMRNIAKAFTETTLKTNTSLIDVPFNAEYTAMQASLNMNRKRENTVLNLSGVAILTAFVRANAGHRFYTSVMPLIKPIKALAGMYERPILTELGVKPKKPRFTIFQIK